MVVFTCGIQQALGIGEDMEITVIEIASGEVRLGIHAPGRCVVRLDTVPLPVGSADLHLVHLEGESGWPYRPARVK